MPPDGQLGEVLFEFRVVGTAVKVTAVHAQSGTEVSLVGPASAPRSQLEQAALAKLRYVLRQAER